MRNKKMKPVAAMMMAITLCGMTGCGRKTVDYNIEITDYTMATKLGVPDSVDVSIDTGRSGLNSIKIKTDDIVLPDTTDMSIVYFDKVEMTEGYKQDVAEYLLNKDEGIDIYDESKRTAKDLQVELDYYEMLSLSEENEYIDELNEQLEDAPDSYRKADKYTYDYYTGVVDGERRILKLGSADACEYLLYGKYWNALNNYRPQNAATFANFNKGECTDDFTGNNTCTITQTAALDKADELLDTLGLTGLTADSSYVVEWSYYGSSENLIMQEYDGYYFYYSRKIDGVPVYNEAIYNVENIESDNYDSIMPEDYLIVAVDGNGILYANWGIFSTLTGEVETNVSLLSWDELMEKLSENLSEYYTEYQVPYTDICFNGAELTYFPVPDGDGGKYVPAWVFTQTETDSTGTETSITQIAVVDATNGEVIDLPEMLATFMGNLN